MNRLEELSQSLEIVRSNIAKVAQHEVTLIAVTKTFPTSDAQILHDLGVRDFGENRDAEGVEKSAIIPATWHFQGQIQSNKLKSITSWATVIHSLDDPRHFEIIEKVAPHPLQIFLQVSLDGAHHRGGAGLEDLYALAALVEKSASHTLAGLMSVPPLGLAPNDAFAQLSLIHTAFMGQFPEAKSLSAGMSGDYEAAISHGATHVRIGSSILGSR
ncbi:MAG: YggS family pyridoxal phosphate-dependent enzyme [Candidatus Planktophila sp.]|nr:YggS family pyridoxal phosphate-dependent enzyme [Candidatus Planktophila sp.]